MPVHCNCKKNPCTPPCTIMHAPLPPAPVPTCLPKDLAASLSFRFPSTQGNTPCHRASASSWGIGRYARIASSTSSPCQKKSGVSLPCFMQVSMLQSLHVGLNYHPYDRDWCHIFVYGLFLCVIAGWTKKVMGIASSRRGIDHGRIEYWIEQ